MRVRDESIMVRLPAGDRADVEAPVQFVWRDRLWWVRSVQRAWVEADPWWDDLRSGRVRAGHGDRRIWRVEASVGAGGVVGVYELSRQGLEWRLRAVID